MDLSSNIPQFRKAKDMSRDDLGTEVGNSGAIIGRYEHSEMIPSVEMAKKIADALEISLVYLVGSSSFTVKDKNDASFGTLGTAP